MASLRTTLQVIEKSLFFRAFAPIIFLALLAVSIYSWANYLFFQAQFTYAVDFWDAEGLYWEISPTAVELESQFRIFASLCLYLTIALCVVGLILNFWAAWAVSNLAGNKGFSKRQYFWLSLIIGPLIPWIIASASKKVAIQ